MKTFKVTISYYVTALTEQDAWENGNARASMRSDRLPGSCADSDKETTVEVEDVDG